MKKPSPLPEKIIPFKSLLIQTLQKEYHDAMPHEWTPETMARHNLIRPLILDNFFLGDESTDNNLRALEATEKYLSGLLEHIINDNEEVNITMSSLDDLSEGYYHGYIDALKAGAL